MSAQDVINAILGVTSNKEVRESMLLGSWLESRWNTNAVGDQGTSFGAFQMHVGGALTAAGGTPALAENPVWAAQHMEPAYQRAVAGFSQSLWGSNPELAAEESAVLAEAPAESYYASQGKGAVNSGWSATQSALKGQVSVSGSPGGNTATGSNASGISTLSVSDPFPGGHFDPLNWPFELGNAASNAILKTLTGVGKKLEADLWAKIKPLAIRLGLILLGAFIVYAGINALTKESAGPTQIVVQGAQASRKAASSDRLYIPARRR